MEVKDNKIIQLKLEGKGEEIKKLEKQNDELVKELFKIKNNEMAG
jgi:hypothetical protein